MAGVGQGFENAEPRAGMLSLFECCVQEQKKRELEEMNRVLAELGIETPPAEQTAKAEPKGEFSHPSPV